eukprot:10349385-Alexandrium_andersonii.AAC.1
MANSTIPGNSCNLHRLRPFFIVRLVLWDTVRWQIREMRTLRPHRSKKCASDVSVPPLGCLALAVSGVPRTLARLHS